MCGELYQVILCRDFHFVGQVAALRVAATHTSCVGGEPDHSTVFLG